jgi:hypothetical protein
VAPELLQLRLKVRGVVMPKSATRRTKQLNSLKGGVVDEFVVQNQVIAAKEMPDRGDVCGVPCGEDERIFCSLAGGEYRLKLTVEGTLPEATREALTEVP